MKRSMVVLVLGLILCLSLTFAVGAQRAYPVRDITSVVVWGAGGGTDLCNRVVLAEMSKVLGVNVNVTNRTGGVAGSVGMNYAFSRPADGYTLAGLSESNVTAAVMGGFGQRFDVWYPFIVGGSPLILSVTPDAPYQSLAELVEASKENPGSIRAGASGAGSIHHLNLLAFEKGTGADFNFIPYPGSAPCQTAAMTGEITVVITSLAEQQQLIRGGKLRPLATMTADAITLADIQIPSSILAYPALEAHLPVSQAIGMAVRAEAPDEVKAKLTEAFGAALETDAVKEWAADNYYVLSGKTGEEASAEFARLESLFSWTLWELGAASVDPATLGIPQP